MTQSNASPSPSNGWPTTSPRKTKRGNASQPRSRRPPTAAKSGSGRSSGRPSGVKNRSRRSELLRRLKIDESELDAQPQIAPLLKQCGILPARVIEVLRADQDEISRSVVTLWDSLTPASRNLLGLEGLAVASGMSPRRLWELYNGANMMQSRESIGAMIADALPAIIQVTLKDAKTKKGFLSREHIFKAARVLPTPKGSVINIGVPQQQDEVEAPEQGRMLDDADDFLLKASRAMQGKALPAPAEPEILDAETVEESEDEK